MSANQQFIIQFTFANKLFMSFIPITLTYFG